ncbi:alcohol dehydrogenase catalytic domain-containing protein [Brevibacterium sediminis]|uniref:alcohol dehydrogenase catalytic domain-containing protein n=1 Tax=Brevibacterium sediminis TaxID=1857024 RepID=UPI00366E323E
MTETMLAALLTEDNAPLDLKQIDIPTPGKGEVLIKMESCGVCHTDIHFWKGEDELPRAKPAILGHEGVGTIVGLGADVVDGTETGQRVGVGFVFSACGTCRECRKGLETYCQDSRATGVDVEGCFAEYVVAPSDWVTAIPESLSSEEACPLLCAGVTAYSAVRKADIEPGSVVVVFGLGGLGQYAVQYAKLFGAKVIGIDLDPKKHETAVSLGAHAAYAPGDEATEAIHALGGADALLSFAPAPQVFRSMFDLAAPTARFIQVALPDKPFSFKAAEIIDLGITIIGSADGTRLERDQVMQLAEEGLVRSTIKSTGFDNINETFRSLDQGEAEGRWVVNF